MYWKQPANWKCKELILILIFVLPVDWDGFLEFGGKQILVQQNIESSGRHTPTLIIKIHFKINLTDIFSYFLLQCWIFTNKNVASHINNWEIQGERILVDNPFWRQKFIKCLTHINANVTQVQCSVNPDCIVESWGWGQT